MDREILPVEIQPVEVGVLHYPGGDFVHVLIRDNEVACGAAPLAYQLAATAVFTACVLV